MSVGSSRTPLTRKTPLARGTTLLAPGKPLARKTPMVRTPPAPRTAPDVPRAPRTPTTTKRRPRPADTGASTAERTLVLTRDRGRCARCGIDVSTGAVGFNDHHRQGRGMGGRQGTARAAANLPSRRLTLCGSGTTRCHGWVTEHPADAERAGLVVRRGGGIDPAVVPVLTWDGWVQLDDDGGITPCPAPPGGDARNLAAL